MNDKPNKSRSLTIARIGFAGLVALGLGAAMVDSINAPKPAAATNIPDWPYSVVENLLNDEPIGGAIFSVRVLLIANHRAPDADARRCQEQTCAPDPLRSSP